MRPSSPALVVAGLAPVSLLAVDPGGWYPFGPLKWLAVSVVAPAGAAVVLARRPLRVEPVTAGAALALVAWFALAAARGTDGVYAWLGTPERHFGVLTWALAAVLLAAGQSLGDDRSRRVVVGGLVVAGAGLGLVATAEAAGRAPGVLDAGGRLGGPLGSPAYLGAAVALLLPVLAGVAADGSWSRAARVIAGAGATGTAVAAVGSGARAAWVGLAAAGLVVGWAQRARLARRPRAVVLVGAGGAVVLTLLVVVGPVGARAASTFDPEAPGGRGRLDEWRVATRVVADHPLVGVGPEGYRIAFAAAVDRDYQRAHGRDPLPDRAHSTPLDVAVTGGAPALAAWLVLVVAVGRSVLVAVAGDRPWLAGLGAGLVAHAAGGLFLFPVVELEPLAWLLAGTLVGAVAAAPDAPGLRGVRRARPVEWPVGRAAVVGLGAVAVVALVAGAAEVAADRHARRAATALAAGDGATAAAEAGAATGLRPDVLRLHLLEARARVADQQGAVAGLAAVDRALGLSPGDPLARRERARLLVDRALATRVPAHAGAARHELARLLEADPLAADLWALAATAAALDGDVEAAREAGTRAGALAPDRGEGT